MERGLLAHVRVLRSRPRWFGRRPLNWIATFCLGCCASFSWAQSLPAPDPKPISDLATIHGLNEAAASQAHPVEVEATVTFIHPAFNWMFVADGQARAFVLGIRHGVIEQGCRVRIHGHTGPGEVRPIILSESVEVLEYGSKLPQPKFIDDLSEVQIGKHDCEYVALEAGLEVGWIEPSRTTFVARHGDFRFLVSVAEPMELGAIRDLTRSTVKFAGALGYRVEKPPFHTPSNQGYVRAFEVFLQSADQVEVLVAPPSTIVPQESVGLARLLDPRYGERCFVTHAQVTWVSPRGAYLEDESAGVFIASDPIFVYERGQVLKIAGSKAKAGVSPEAVQPLGISAVHRPPLSSWSVVSDRSGSWRRINLKGELHDLVCEDGRCTMVLSQGASKVEVNFDEVVGADQVLDLATAKGAEVCGILLPEDDESLVLRVTEAEDVRVLSRQSTVGLVPVLLTVSVLLGVLAVCFLWLGTLRSRVAEKTRDLSDLTAQLSTSYEAIGDGVLALDCEGRVITANRALRDLLRLDVKPSDPGERFLEAVLSRAAKPEELQGHWDHGCHDEGYESEFELSLGEPEAGAVVVRTAPIRDEDPSRTVLGRLWVLRDETEQRELERRLVHAQKMEAIGALAGGIAHDFNNVLTVVLANLNLARQSTTDANARAYLDPAASAATSAAHVVSKLLGFSRNSSLRLQACDMNSIVENVLKLIEHALDPSIRIEVELTENLPLVMGDPTLLEQVILNICVNARDAMPEGGIVCMSTSASKGPDGLVVVSIRDTGQGIQPEHRDKVFEPYFTTKPGAQGTGLGLSVSYGVIEQHAGVLDFESELGEGTVFRVGLPARPDLELEPEAKSQASVEQTATATVLVVDDDPSVLDSTEIMLSRAGFDVCVAESGDEALQLLNEKAVDALVVDWSMPGMSGLELIARLRQGSHRDLPVILCSGHDVERQFDNPFEEAERRANCRADLVLQKPLHILTLAEDVQSLLVTSREE